MPWPEFACAQRAAAAQRASALAVLMRRAGPEVLGMTLGAGGRGTASGGAGGGGRAATDLWLLGGDAADEVAHWGLAVQAEGVARLLERQATVAARMRINPGGALEPRPPRIGRLRAAWARVRTGLRALAAGVVEDDE